MDQCAADRDHGMRHGLDVRPSESLTEATVFLRTCRDEIGEAFGSDERIRQVGDEIDRTATYRQEFAELEYGCRLAWRNSLDCLGKGMWRRLEVRDCRAAQTFDEVFEACIEHLQLATRGGRTKTVITVFRPVGPDDAGVRILNKQLVMYAGYRRDDGSVLGDPTNIDFTQAVQALGWCGENTPFDVLPLVIRIPGQRPRWVPIPDGVALEIPLSHPDLSWFGELGLRWYSHPTISNQLLRVGGISYPAAPFSGWYTCSEIAMLNLGGSDRYNVLPSIAEHLGLNTSSRDRSWRDRALSELRRAVMHSFAERRVTIVDDYTAANSFARHCRRELASGRLPLARRASLTNAVAESAHHLFTGEYEEAIKLPNFFSQTPEGM